VSGPQVFKRRKPLIHRNMGGVEYVTIGCRTFVMDAEDLHLLEGWRIKVTTRNYVQLDKLGTPHQYRYLARVIMNAPVGTHVDHVSGDPLDNRKSNLRICTCAENQHNRKRARDSQSPFKGVWFDKHQCGVKKWRMQVCLNRVRYTAGFFLTAEEAAEAYNAKARELFGEFARLNVIGNRGETVSVEAHV